MIKGILSESIIKGVFDGEQYEIYEEFIINKANYYYLLKNDFAGDILSGFVEAQIYVDGINGTRYIFCSDDEGYNIRYFHLFTIDNRLYIAIRDAGTPNIYNAVYADEALSVGWHTVKFISTGSDYKLMSGSYYIPFTVLIGNDDGKWIGDTGYAAFLRDNICIGAFVDKEGVHTSDEFIMRYVNFNNTNKWIASGI